jgi:hypothetical protein
VPGAVRHLRAIHYRRPGTIGIADRVEGSGRHRLEWFFHLAPDLEVRIDDDGILAAVDPTGAPMLTLRCSASPQPILAVVRGQDAPLLGWVSTDSATAVPAAVAVYRLDTTLPFTCDFEIEVPADAR